MRIILSTRGVSDFSRDGFSGVLNGQHRRSKTRTEAGALCLSPRNRYEATRTGLPSPENEVARLPKGDIGKENGMSKGKKGRKGGPDEGPTEG